MEKFAAAFLALCFLSSSPADAAEVYGYDALGLPITFKDGVLVEDKRPRPKNNKPEVHTMILSRQQGEYLERAIQAASAGGDIENLTMAVLMNVPPAELAALIDAGQDVNAQDELFGTALYQAVYQRRGLDRITLLLEKGADPNRNFGNHNAHASVLYAAADRNPEAIPALIGAKVDLNALDPHGNAPLVALVGRGRLDMVKLMVEAGADVNIKEKDGLTPLYAAASTGGEDLNLDMLRYLLEHGAKPKLAKSRTDEGLLASITWWPKERIPVIKLLVEAGAPIPKLIYHDETPMWRAVLLGDLELVEALIKRKASLAAAPRSGNYPLIRAVYENRPDILQALIKAKADLNVAEHYGYTALHRAVYANSPEMLNMLLKAGAKPDQPDGYGRTPLYHAVEKGRLDLVKLLLAAKADPVKANVEGETPLHEAASKDDPAILAALLAVKPDLEKTELGRRRTPLHYAVDYGEVEHVKLLLAAGADPNKADIHGETPLHLAGKDKAELLLKAGADPSKTDAYGHAAGE